MQMKQVLITKLVDHGVWDEEAEEIFKIYSTTPVAEVMKGRWNDDESVYGDRARALIAANWLVLKATASKWLEEHRPLHFARIMLADDPVKMEAELDRLEAIEAAKESPGP